MTDIESALGVIREQTQARGPERAPAQQPWPTSGQLRDAYSNPASSANNLLDSYSSPVAEQASALGISMEELIALSGPQDGGRQPQANVPPEIASLQWLEEMEVRNLVDTQRRMWVLGFYDNGVVPEWGRIDVNTRRAAVRFWQTASSNIEVVQGEDGLPVERMVSPRQTLFDLADGLDIAADVEGMSSLTEAAMSVDPISSLLQNPADLERVYDQTYRGLMGRRPGADDKRAFVAAFHAFQRQNAEAELRYGMQMEDARVAEGETPQIVETTAPMDASTFTERYIQAQDPVAYEGEQAIDATQVISERVRQG